MKLQTLIKRMNISQQELDELTALKHKNDRNKISLGVLTLSAFILRLVKNIVGDLRFDSISVE